MTNKTDKLTRRQFAKTMGLTVEACLLSTSYRFYIKQDVDYLEGKFKPSFELELSENGLFLIFTVEKFADNQKTSIVSSKQLGCAFHSEAIFENADGTPIFLKNDFFGKNRDDNPTIGPFDNMNVDTNKYLLWTNKPKN